MAEMNEPTTRVRTSPEFCDTHWTVIRRAGSGESERAAEALEQLCRAYWYPLYAYARRRGHSAEDAEDLTQGFIARLLRRRDLGSVTPEKGRFRTFLLVSFANYMVNEWHRDKCEKRGGFQVILALDSLSAEERYRHEPATADTPEGMYDQRWAWAIIDAARQRLAAEYQRAGKSEMFALLEPLSPGEHNRAARQEIATRLGISAGAVGVGLHRLRRRYAAIIRELIGETVSTPQEVDAELRELMGVLRG